MGAPGLGHPCHPLQLPPEGQDSGELLGAGLADGEEEGELRTEFLAERTLGFQAQVRAAEAMVGLKHCVSVYNSTGTVCYRETQRD